MVRTIGIVGGGQLGRMLTLAALPLGFEVVAVDPNENSPAAQAGARAIVADLYDEKALRQLAALADVITIEIEHLDVGVLESIAALGKPVHPAPATIRLIQDKLRQKEFLRANGIPVAQFVEITDEAAAQKALRDFGGKMLIKTRYGAYDGRGNMVIKNAREIKKAFKAFAGKQLYAEKFVPFVKELAVMVAKGGSGEIKTYPVVETIHARNICLEVLAPAPVAENPRKQAEKIAHKVAGKLDGAGMFGIELFLTRGGKILVNEIAPRVHNSGHFTVDACRISQFEQHIRAVTGLPLGQPDMTTPAAVMINILGERNGPTRLAGLDAALAIPHTSIHMYGKSPTKVDRKMGHLTATGVTVKQARNRARAARKQISV